MKIALCFWGLTRSLKYTIESIKKYIFEPLKKAGIEYDIYLHTYYLEGLYCNEFGKEYDIKLDVNEYKLLNPDYVKIDNQDKVIEKIDFTKYNHKKGRKEVHYNRQTHNNAILGLYSMREATKMIKENNKKYDFIFFLRPDMKYLREFNPRWFLLTKNIKVLTTRFGKSGGYNDRMFVGNYQQGLVFGQALDYLEEYIKDNIFVAEPFIKWLVHKYCFPDRDTMVRFIDYSFQRVRATGQIAHLDRNLTGY